MPALSVGFSALPSQADTGIRGSLTEFHTLASTGRHWAIMFEVHNVGKMEVLCGQLGNHTGAEAEQTASGPKDRQSQEYLKQCLTAMCPRKEIRSKTLVSFLSSATPLGLDPNFPAQIFRPIII